MLCLLVREEIGEFDESVAESENVSIGELVLVGEGVSEVFQLEKTVVQFLVFLDSEDD